MTDELDDMRQNIHRLTFHLFNNRTHVPPREGSFYFGNGKKSGKTGAALDQDFERLLNIGSYSSANPVIARVGTYMEPIVDAVQSGLSVSRVIYNIFTWRDPMLSFWVTIFFMVTSLILFLFPWRLFLFFAGFGILGPQNWLIRVLDERRLAPARLQKILDKLKQSKKSGSRNDPRKKNKSCITEKESLIDRPIISSHTSDNTAPPELSHDTVDPRTLHQVIVPYSQLLSQRFYDWPPEPQYAKCEPIFDVGNIDGNIDGSEINSQGIRKRQSSAFVSKELNETTTVAYDGDGDLTRTRSKSENGTGNRVRFGSL